MKNINPLFRTIGFRPAVWRGDVTPSWLRATGQFHPEAFRCWRPEHLRPSVEEAALPGEAHMDFELPQWQEWQGSQIVDGFGASLIQTNEADLPERPWQRVGVGAKAGVLAQGEYAYLQHAFDDAVDRLAFHAYLNFTEITSGNICFLELIDERGLCLLRVSFEAAANSCQLQFVDQKYTVQLPELDWSWFKLNLQPRDGLLEMSLNHQNMNASFEAGQMHLAGLKIGLIASEGMAAIQFNEMVWGPFAAPLIKLEDHIYKWGYIIQKAWLTDPFA